MQMIIDCPMALCTVVRPAAVTLRGRKEGGGEGGGMFGICPLLHLSDRALHHAPLVMMAGLLGLIPYYVEHHTWVFTELGLGCRLL